MFFFTDKYVEFLMRPSIVRDLVSEPFHFDEKHCLTLVPQCQNMVDFEPSSCGLKALRKKPAEHILLVSFQLVVVIKYLFQFQFYSWNREEVALANLEDPFWWPRILGIEKKHNYAHCDLALLLALFFHRSILKVKQVCFQSRRHFQYELFT